MSIKIKFNKEECIGCGACTVQCPENWELVEDERGFIAKPIQTNLQEVGKNQEAVDICPVDCIEIIEE